MKKRLIGGLLAGILCLGLLSGCKSEGQGEIESKLERAPISQEEISEENSVVNIPNSSDTQVFHEDGVYLKFPHNWTASEDDPGIYTHPVYPGFIMIQITPYEGLSEELAYSAFINGLENSDNTKIIEESTGTNSNNIPWRRIKCMLSLESGIRYRYCTVVITSNSIININWTSEYDAFPAECEKIINSLKLDEE